MQTVSASQTTVFDEAQKMVILTPSPRVNKTKEVASRVFECRRRSAEFVFNIQLYVYLRNSHTKNKAAITTLGVITIKISPTATAFNLHTPFPRSPPPKYRVVSPPRSTYKPKAYLTVQDLYERFARTSRPYFKVQDLYWRFQKWARSELDSKQIVKRALFASRKKIDKVVCSTIKADRKERFVYQPSEY